MILVQILLYASKTCFRRKIFDLWKKMEQLSTLHINSHIFPKHYNFHEIMLYSQYPSENFQAEICVLSNNLKIFRREDSFTK